MTTQEEPMSVPVAGLDGLRELAEKATKGPWIAHPDGLVWRIDDVPGDPVSGSTEYEDAAYIAAANPATILALLDELDRLSR